MEFGAIFQAAIQSSFLLGLLHGINPCGHSWLVLAPFVAGEQKGGRVALLTIMFLAGTGLACLVLGATLGAVSQLFPASFALWVEGITSIILILIGVLLLYDPHILHTHDHDHEHHDHPHEEGNCCQGARCTKWNMKATLQKMTSNSALLPLALFTIGFVNMIIPCPTAAVMYGYALNSESVIEAVAVFGAYAVSTALAVGAVIFLIFKATKKAQSLNQDWVEPFVMRLAGAVIVLFSAYSLYQLVTA